MLCASVSFLLAHLNRGKEWVKAGMLNPRPAGQIQAVALCHLAHGSKKLAAGEQWHCFPDAKFSDLWGAPDHVCWIGPTIQVPRAQQGWYQSPGPNSSVQRVRGGWSGYPIWPIDWPHSVHLACTDHLDLRAKRLGITGLVLMKQESCLC